MSAVVQVVQDWRLKANGSVGPVPRSRVTTVEAMKMLSVELSRTLHGLPYENQPRGIGNGSGRPVRTYLTEHILRVKKVRSVIRCPASVAVRIVAAQLEGRI